VAEARPNQAQRILVALASEELVSFLENGLEGIIPSDNEETGWLEDEQEGRERRMGILIRYLSAPIILIIAIIAFSLLL